VGELEVEGERAEDGDLLRRLQGGDGLVDLLGRAALARRARHEPDPLHELEEPWALLLGEDDPEDRPQESHVAMERLRVAVELLVDDGRLHQRSSSRRRSTSSTSGSTGVTAGVAQPAY